MFDFSVKKKSVEMSKIKAVTRSVDFSFSTSFSIHCQAVLVEKT